MMSQKARAVAAVTVIGLVSTAIPSFALAAPLTCGGEAATIVGTDDSETIRGTSADDVIVALGGADRVWGGGGNDLICGGPGNDRLVGDAGDDRLFGGAGDDLIKGKQGDDYIDGGAGDNKLLGGLGNDIIEATHENGMSPSNEDHTQWTGDNWVGGGGGSDEIFLSFGANFVKGGPSGDHIEVRYGPVGDLFEIDETLLSEIRGGGGPDYIVVEASPSIIRGGGGSDLIQGGAGSDHIIAKGGNDRVKASAHDWVQFGKGTHEIYIKPDWSRTDEQGNPPTDSHAWVEPLALRSTGSMQVFVDIGATVIGGDGPDDIRIQNSGEWAFVNGRGGDDSISDKSDVGRRSLHGGLGNDFLMAEGETACGGGTFWFDELANAVTYGEPQTADNVNCNWVFIPGTHERDSQDLLPGSGEPDRSSSATREQLAASRAAVLPGSDPRN